VKKILIPANFSGTKFAARYSLAEADFFTQHDALGALWLHFPDSLPDSPVLETNDPLPEKPSAEIDRIESGSPLAGDILQYLRWLLKTRALPK